MRKLLGLTLALCGCQLLPHKEVLCADGDVCPPLLVTSSFVLGQVNEKTNAWSGGLTNPIGVALIGDKLAVADHDNWRILIWNTFPTQNDQPADLALGQTSTSLPISTPNYDTGDVVPNPYRLSSDGMRLIVSDDNGSTFTRELRGWNSIPTSNNAQYSYSFSGTVGGAASSYTSSGPLLVANHLYLADRVGNRVLYTDPIPTTGFVDALPTKAALGQVDLNGMGANASGLMANSLSGPDGSPGSDGTRLLVPDTGNNRVLIWNSLPTTNQVAADMVLGQANMTSGMVNHGAPNADLTTLSKPSGVSLSTNGHLAVVDRGNNRVLLWNQLPTSPGQAADLVLGQSSPATVDVNNNGVSASSMNGPQAVTSDGNRLVVSDSGNHRVLIWNTWPTTSGAPADIILGQADPTLNGARGRMVSTSHFIAPTGLARAGRQFLVVDRDAHRVLLYPQLPTSPSDMPTVVLGQPSFSAQMVNNSGPAANSLSGPRTAASDGTVLAVADTDNHRVLLWKTLPTQNQQPADLVLGQINVSNVGANAGGSSRGLNAPFGVHIAGGRLYVADTANNRVLIWKSIPMQNQQQADVVLGQSGISDTDNKADRGGMANSNTLDSPWAVYTDAAHIYVADGHNNRLLIWNTLDPTNGQAADLVVGQPDLMSTMQPGSASPTSLIDPFAIQTDASRLYVVDRADNRVVIWNPIPAQINPSGSGALGQPDLFKGGPNTDRLGADRLQDPQGILVTEAGIYIADTGNGRVVALPPIP